MASLTKIELFLLCALPLAAAAVLAVAIPSHLAVRKCERARELVKDAKELSTALKQQAYRGNVPDGGQVAYSDLEPWLSETSELKARGGKDCFGNPWGPFVVGQPLRPSEDSVRRCEPLVPSNEWNRLK